MMASKQPGQPPLEAVRIGTRGSALALWQAHLVRALLVRAWPTLTVEIEVMKTQGDATLDTPLPQIGGKGVFTAELEAALRSGAIDLAVHSLKDLPTEESAGLIIGAIPERGDPRDALVSRENDTLEALPEGAAVGTSSRRRAARGDHFDYDHAIRKLFALDPTTRTASDTETDSDNGQDEG